MSSLQYKSTDLLITLPAEIAEKIWLLTDYDVLQSTRIFQSKHVRDITRFGNMSDAAENGNPKNMQWIKENKDLWKESETPWLFDTLFLAVAVGKIMNVEWLLINKCPGDVQTMEIAALKGHLDIMKLLFLYGYPLTLDVFRYAIINGSMEIIEWLYENKCPYNESTFAFAALEGYLIGMMWLYHHKCPLDEIVFTFAARNGRLVNMIWLLEKRCPWDERTVIAAVETENFEVLEWLFTNGCPFTEHVFVHAAHVGNFKIMQFLKRIGCLWNEQTFEAAALYEPQNIDTGLVENHVKSLKWTDANDDIMNDLVKNFTFLDQVKNKSLRNMKWLRNHKCPWNERVFLNAVRVGDLEIIQWLIDMECPFNRWEALKIAAECKNTELMYWLIENLN